MGPRCIKTLRCCATQASDQGPQRNRLFESGGNGGWWSGISPPDTFKPLVTCQNSLEGRALKMPSDRPPPFTLKSPGL